MRKTHFFNLAGYTPPLLVSLILTAEIDSARLLQMAMSVHAQNACSDSPNNCKSPVKYLGEKDGCACFACEYGKKNQRVICTNNQGDREKLMMKVRESMPKKTAPRNQRR